jgi:hypothetical protein
MQLSGVLLQKNPDLLLLLERAVRLQGGVTEEVLYEGLCLLLLATHAFFLFGKKSRLHGPPITR